MGKSGKRKKDKGHSSGKPAKKAREEPKSSGPPDPPPEPLGSLDSQQGDEEPHQRVFKMKPKYWFHNLPDGYGKSAGLSWGGARLIHTGLAMVHGCWPELRVRGRCRVNVVGCRVMSDSAGVFRAV